MKKTYLFLFFIIIISVSCKNKDIFNLTSFDGYTSRNLEGFVVGTADSTDWTINDDWKRNPKKLFEDYDNYQYNTTTTDTLTIKALPNPTSQNVYLSLIKPESVKFDYRIVNENWDILHSENDITNKKITINIKEYITDESVVRIYYRFKTSDNKAFIGHGDIRIY